MVLQDYDSAVCGTGGLFKRILLRDSLSGWCEESADERRVFSLSCLIENKKKNLSWTAATDKIWALAAITIYNLKLMNTEWLKSVKTNY